ncbi:MAG: amidohydrolase family protein [Hyphomicrobiales bacterium]|nr:amidohydrolase family protein [Hyphomicrobiales bacterium]
MRLATRQTRTPAKSRRLLLTLAAVCALSLSASASLHAQTYDLVLANGRVLDPESGLDAVRNVGIADGRIAAISVEALDGERVVDVAGLVVAPGFIDLHAHAHDPITHGFLARDGVTTALEMEGGVWPVSEWYGEHEGTSRINFGAGVSHPGARIEVLEEDPDALETLGDSTHWSHDVADAEQLEAIVDLIHQGLDEGAIGVGLGIQYTPGATRDEVWRVYQAGAEHGVTGFAHVRFASMAEPGSSIESMQEMIALAATGASVHMCHIASTGLGKVPIMLEMFDAARAKGLDISTEVYPYTASSSFIGAAILDPGWRERLGRDYGDIAWAATGERLTEETFIRYREEQPGGIIVAHVMEEENVIAALQHPDVMIAADGGSLAMGRGHPRSAGSHARVLGVYVREKGALSLMDAVRKMTLMPARRMETAVASMGDKGRIRVGADADLTIFDPKAVIDNATFDEPALPSTGIPYVLVGGTFVVEDSELVEGAVPGQPVRRAVEE